MDNNLKAKQSSFDIFWHDTSKYLCYHLVYTKLKVWYAVNKYLQPDHVLLNEKVSFDVPRMSVREHFIIGNV